MTSILIPERRPPGAAATAAPPAPPRECHCDAPWSEAVAIFAELRRVVELLPPTERGGLGRRLIRSAGTITGAIYEAARRPCRGERIHHLSVARGALAELEAALVEAERHRLIEGARARRLERGCERLCRLLGRAVLTLHP